MVFEELLVQLTNVITILLGRGEVGVFSINEHCSNVMFLEELCLNVCEVLLQQCGNGGRGEPCDTDTALYSRLEKNVIFCLRSAQSTEHSSAFTKVIQITSVEGPTSTRKEYWKSVYSSW